MWSDRLGACERTGPPGSTLFWQRPLEERRQESLFATLATPRFLARFRAVFTAGSAVLYSKLPCSRDGTRLTDLKLTSAVDLRLGLPVAAQRTSFAVAFSTSLAIMHSHAVTASNGSAYTTRPTQGSATFSARPAIRQCLSPPALPSATHDALMA